MEENKTEIISNKDEKKGDNTTPLPEQTKKVTTRKPAVRKPAAKKPIVKTEESTEAIVAKTTPELKAIKDENALSEDITLENGVNDEVKLEKKNPKKLKKMSAKIKEKEKKAKDKAKQKKLKEKKKEKEKKAKKKKKEKAKKEKAKKKLKEKKAKKKVAERKKKKKAKKK